MRKFSLILVSFAVAAAVLLSSVRAEPTSATMNYAIMRNGDQIGTSTVRLHRNGRHRSGTIHIQPHRYRAASMHVRRPVRQARHR